MSTDHSVPTLAGKAVNAEKRAFFQILAGKAGKTSTFATALAGKAEILFFSSPFNFYWSIEYNILDIQNELITFNTYSN